MKMFVWACLFFVPMTAFCQNEAALVAAVRAKLNKVANYKATGQMKIDVSFINAPNSGVTVYYKKPDRFKVQKSDGISILPKGGVTMNLQSLLSDENYAIVPAGNAVVRGKATKAVKLLPLNEGGDIVLMTLYIDEKDLLIRKHTVTTKESGSYEIELDYGKYAAWGLPDKVAFLFSTKNYKMPKGITFDYEKGNSKKPAAADNGKGKVEIVYNNYIINKGVDDKVFLTK